MYFTQDWLFVLIDVIVLIEAKEQGLECSRTRHRDKKSGPSKFCETYVHNMALKDDETGNRTPNGEHPCDDEGYIRLNNPRHA